MKFWLLTSMFMLTAVGYASVVAPCQKAVSVDLSGHIARAVPVEEVAKRSSTVDYSLFPDSEGTSTEAKDGTATGPSGPAVEPAAPVKAPEVSPGSGTDQPAKDPEKNYLIYFTATWCGPCRSQKPVIEEIRDAGKHKVHIIDIDQNREAARQWGISSVPVIEVVREGKRVWRAEGAGHSRAVIESKLEGK